MPQNPQGQSRPSRGDMTGRTKADAQKEARLADQERADEARTAAAVQSHEELNGVFDAQSGERIDAPAPTAVLVEERPEPQFFAPDEEIILTGQEDPDEVAPILAARKQFSRPPVGVTRDPFVIVRIDQDVEKMTYGMTPGGEPNNFNFKEGQQYKIPVEVADWLNERGLIRQWGKG